MDFGCKIDGYCSDFTRTVAISDVDKEQQNVYDIVNTAGQMALQALGPGKRACDVDAVARGYIADMGYGEAFGHGLGHSVGLAVHEAPALNARTQDELAPGMAVTIEPGIYLKGRFGRAHRRPVCADGNGIPQPQQRAARFDYYITTEEQVWLVRGILKKD